MQNKSHTILDIPLEETAILNYSKLENEQCHPFQLAFEAARLYYLPVIISVGIIGNVLSCLVFLNTHLKMRSSSYYLAALACADSGFLGALLLVWLSMHWDLPIFNVNGYCQCIVYLSSVCSFLSVWLIVAFTVERFIAVQYPLKKPHMCTVARAKTIITYLLATATVGNSYVFVTSGIIHNGEINVCEMLTEYHDIMWVINILDFFVTLLVPTLLIVVMNTMITINLLKFSKFNHKELNGLYAISFLNIPEIHLTDRQIMETLKCQFEYYGSQRTFLKDCNRLIKNRITGKSTNLKTSSAGNRFISVKTQHNITKMLLLISSVFILLNLPSYAIRLYVFVFTTIWQEAIPTSLWCLQQMLMYLYYTNFSINFLLYSMCGVTFRKCLWQMMTKKFKRTVRNFYN